VAADRRPEAEPVRRAVVPQAGPSAAERVAPAAVLPEAVLPEAERVAPVVVPRLALALRPASAVSDRSLA